MKQLQLKHWQDPVTALLGAWFAASPWVLGAPADPAWYGVLAVGLGLLAFGLVAAVKPRAALHWANAGLAILAALLPWLLSYSGEPRAMENAVVVGVLALLLSLWALGEDDQLGGWHHDRMAH